MEPVMPDHDQDSLELLFDLFNDDLCSSPSIPYEDNGDDNDTSSESSGSSGRCSSSTSSSSHLLSFHPSREMTFESETTDAQNKRRKTEDKLLRNRLSANKSRLKRKNERLQLEETVATLRERVRSLEMENNALLTDNTTLSQQNFFLQELLRKQQIDTNIKECKSKMSEDPSKNPSYRTHMSALSGISVLCVVFSVSFFRDILPSSLFSSSENSWGTSERASGRVLLSLDDEDDDVYSVNNPEYFVSVANPTSSAGVVLQYIFILTSVFLYYCYAQYENKMKRKPHHLLPS